MMHMTLPGLAALLVTYLVLLAATHVPSPVPADGTAALVAAVRHARLVVVLAGMAAVSSAAGLGFALLWTNDLDGSRAAAIAPGCSAAVALAGLGLGELTWPRPRGALRVAQFSPRSIGTLTPGPWWGVAGLALALFTVTAAVGVLLADSHGRYLQIGATTDGPRTAFPGAYYVVPQLIVLAVNGLLLGLSLLLTVHRPAIVGAAIELDLWYRRVTTSRLMCVALMFLLVTAAGDLYFMSTAFSSADVGHGAETWVPALLAVACLIAAASAPILAWNLLRASRSRKDQSVVVSWV